MARANVEIVKQVYDSLRRRDMAGIMLLLAPDIELVQSAELPWGGTYRGHSEVQQFFGKLGGHITSTPVFEGFIDAGDHVVAIGRTQGTVNATDRPFDLPIAHVWELRDGQVTRVRICVDNPSMLAALDLQQ